MGKAARWFRLFLGLKQPDPTNPNPKDKRRWSFVKSYRDKHPTKPPPPLSSSSTTHDATSSAYVGDSGDVDASKHAIAVAAATAAVAEAAVAAAQAAAAVVRLTHGGGGLGHAGRCEGAGFRELQVRAAVVIQSYFRGYLARRALRALKGLVKLQALVRGHIMRKKTAETMRCMQAMLRAQARARCVRAYLPESPNSSSKSCQLLQHPGPPTPEKYEQIRRAKASKQDQPPPNIRRNLSRPSSTRGHLTSSSWSDPRMDNEPMWDPRGGATSSRTCMTDDADRILEIDPGKPPFTLRRKAHSSDTTTSSATHHHLPHLSTTTFSGEVVQSLLNPLKFHHHHHETENEDLYCTAENSPHCHSAAASQGGSSMRGGGGLFTPTKSDGSRSFLSGYSDCPSYMADTESSRAKMRSMSAPKQRPHYYERAGSTRSRYSVHGGLGGDHHNHPPRSNPQRAAAMHASFASKAYPGSGRLDRLGMPVRDSTVVYYSGYLN